MTSPTPTPCVLRNCIHHPMVIGPGELQIWVCQAFPGGIPDDILSGANKHLISIPGDDGIHFESGVRLKHLPGEHDQETHGDRGVVKPPLPGMKYQSFGWLNRSEIKNIEYLKNGYVNVNTTTGRVAQFANRDRFDRWYQMPDPNKKAAAPTPVKKIVAKKPADPKVKKEEGEVDSNDELGNNDIESAKGKAYILNGEDRLFDVSPYGGAHFLFVAEHVAPFGLDKSDRKELMKGGGASVNAWQKIFNNGAIRGREIGKDVNLETAKIDTPTLRRIQRLSDAGKIKFYPGSNNVWGSSDEIDKSLYFSYEDIMGASRVVDKDGEITLKEMTTKERIAAITLKHLPGQHNQLEHGNRGEDGGVDNYDVPDRMINKVDGGIGPSIQYHGTSDVNHTLVNQPYVFLTPDPKEADGYANDFHRLGESPAGKNAKKQILYMRRKPGKALSIDADIIDEFQNGMGDIDAVIAKKAEYAKSAGFRYLYYPHPSFYKNDGEQDVVVSLYPNEDLKQVGKKSVKELIAAITLKHLPGEHDQERHGDREEQAAENEYNQSISDIDSALLGVDPESKKIPFTEVGSRQYGFINPKGDALIGSNYDHSDWIAAARENLPMFASVKGFFLPMGYVRFISKPDSIQLHLQTPVRPGARRAIQDYMIMHPEKKVHYDVVNDGKTEWGDNDRDAFGKLTGIELKERMKHLPGEHDQRRHGWRFSGTAPAASTFRTPEEHAEFTRRLQGVIGERTRYAQANKNIYNARDAYANYEIRKTELNAAYETSSREVGIINDRLYQVRHDAMEQNTIFEKKLDENQAKINKLKEDPNYKYDDLTKLQKQRKAIIKKYYGENYEGGLIGDLRKEEESLGPKLDDARKKSNDAYTTSIEFMKAGKPDLTNMAADVKTSMEIGMKLGAKKRQSLLVHDASIQKQNEALNKQEAELASKRSDLVKSYRDQYGDNYFEYLRLDPKYQSIRDKQSALSGAKEMVGASRQEKKLYDQEQAIQAQADKTHLNSDAEREKYSQLTENLIQVQSKRSDLYTLRKEAERTGFYMSGNQSSSFEFDISTQLPGQKSDYQAGINFVNGLAGDNTLVKAKTVKILSMDELGNAGSIEDRSRSFALEDEIHLAGKSYANSVTLIHEMGHVIEARDPLIHGEIVKFLDKRTAGQPEIKLNTTNSAYRPDEISVPDHFMDPYIGKIYKAGGKTYASEVLSMGLEQLYRSAKDMARSDPEYFDFIYAIMKMGN